MKPSVDLKIVQATIADHQLFFNFMQKNFYPEEPMNKSIGRIPKTIEELPTLGILANGYSFKAINALDESEDNVLGIVLNADRTPSDKGIREEWEKKSKDPGLAKIIQLLDVLEHGANFWDRVTVDKSFDTIVLSVKPGYRGLQIGRKLLEKSLEHAKSLNYQYATIECSSIYSAKISADLGYELFHEIPFKDYRDSNNEIIFKVDPPHTAIKLYVKKI